MVAEDFSMDNQFQILTLCADDVAQVLLVVHFPRTRYYASVRMLAATKCKGYRIKECRDASAYSIRCSLFV